MLARAGAALETGAVVGLPATAPAPEAADPVGASGEAIRMLAGDGGGALGWAGAAPAGPLDWLRRVASWLLVGLACTLGGPFWFDLLRALLRLRAGAIGLCADLERLRRALGGRASGDRHARGREPSGAPAVPAPAAPDPVAASGDAAPGRPG